MNITTRHAAVDMQADVNGGNLTSNALRLRRRQTESYIYFTS